MPGPLVPPHDDFAPIRVPVREPNPGTVIFAGYGTSLGRTVVGLDPRAPYDDLDRTADGFFLKLSYLFRL